MKKLKILLLIIVTIMAFYGIVMIYSASSIWAEYKFNDAFHFAKYQFIFFIISFLCMLIVKKIDYNKPRIVHGYDGGDIILSEGIVSSPTKFSELKAHVGEDIIVTDGMGHLYHAVIRG